MIVFHVLAVSVSACGDRVDSLLLIHTDTATPIKIVWSSQVRVRTINFGSELWESKIGGTLD